MIQKRLLRLFSSDAFKVDIKLVAKLRKETECSMIKAKEVLLATKNDYGKAIDILNAQTVNIDKLKQRTTQEGLIAVANHPAGYHSAMLELNCETDFVAKNESFVEFSIRAANTCALTSPSQGGSILSQIDIQSLVNRNLLNGHGTIDEELLKLVGKLKENITLRRAITCANQDSSFVSAAYAHSGGLSLPPGVGRLGSIVVLKAAATSTTKLAPEKRESLTLFAKRLAQHISGFAPTTIRECGNESSDNVLMAQDFLFGGGKVSDIVQKVGLENSVSLEIVDFKRWVCGEGIERKQEDFAAEVMAQMKKNT
jgi:elongation factor Ts